MTRAPHPPAEPARSGPLRAALRGAARSAAWTAALPALALALAALAAPLAPPRPAPGPYTGAVEARETGGAEGEAGQEAPRLWLVDGYNVLHAGLLSGRERGRWWRPAAREALLSRAAAFDDPAAELWVVFDGPRPEGGRGGPEARPRVAFARSADAWLLARVKAAPDPARVAVVTGDRKLAGRARHRGARVVRPLDFLSRCGEGPGARAGARRPQAERS